MKYLILALLLMGCEKEAAYPKPQLVKSVGRVHECNLILQLGYRIDGNACVKHIDTPKFKTAELHRIKNDAYANGCKFQIYRPVWSHGYVMNKPGYYGKVFCLDENGKSVEFKDNVFIQESELK